MKINNIQNYNQSFKAKFTKEFKTRLDNGREDCYMKMANCNDKDLKPALAKDWRDYNTNVLFLKETAPDTLLDVKVSKSKMFGMSYDILMQDKKAKIIVTSLDTNNDKSINLGQLKEIVKEIKNPIFNKARKELNDSLAGKVC